MSTCLAQEQFEEFDQDNHIGVQGFDMTIQLILSNPVRVTVECCKLWLSATRIPFSSIMGCHPLPTGCFVGSVYFTLLQRCGRCILHTQLTGRIYLYINKLATLVEGDLKAPFSIATIPRCRGGRYSFPWIALLYPWSVPYNAEC